MSNLKNNNALLAVEESSENKTVNVRFPNNDLYRLSRYIVAIGTYLECPKLMGPVSEHFGGEEYTFEFYDPEKGALYKVFDSISSEYEKYAQHPSKPILIVNVDVFKGQWVVDNSLYEYVICFGELLKDIITNTESTYLYYDERLWRFQKELADGTTHWESIIPSLFDQYHLHALDVEEDGDENDDEENEADE